MLPPKTYIFCIRYVLGCLVFLFIFSPIVALHQESSLWVLGGYRICVYIYYVKTPPKYVVYYIYKSNMWYIIYIHVYIHTHGL